MAFNKLVLNSLDSFLSNVSRGGSILNLGGPATIVNSITTPGPVTSGTPLVFTVTLKSATTATTAVLYTSTGTAVGDYNVMWAATFSNGVIQQGGQLLIPSGVSSFTITYTTVLRHFVTPLTWYTFVDFVTCGGAVLNAADQWTLIPGSMGTVFPSDFTSIMAHTNFSNYLHFDTFPVENFRTHDHGNHGGVVQYGFTYPKTVFWSEIETNPALPGTYDWAAFDTLVAYMYGRGIGITFTLYGTPAFRAITPPNVKWVANKNYITVTPANYAHGYSSQHANSQLDFVKYAHPTTLASRRYAPVATGLAIDSGLTFVSGSTEPVWPSIASTENTSTAPTKVWAGGTLTVSWTAHGLTTGDVAYFWEFGTTPYEGFHQVTVTDANTFSFPLASNPGTTYPGFSYIKTFMDGTVRWAPARLALDDYSFDGGAYPADPVAVSAFIAAVMARYNTGGIRKITKLEIWNEPGNTQEGKMFYSGSMPQLVDMAWAARLASKAADGGTNNIPVIGCGFTFDSSINSSTVIMSSFLTAAGVTYSTKHGWETLVDGISWHSYGSTTGAGSILNGTGVNGTWFLNTIRSTITSAGGSGSTIPLHLSEYGLMPDTYTTQIAQINNDSGTVTGGMTPTSRYQYMMSNFLFYAGCNVKTVTMNDYEGNFGGRFDLDTADNSNGFRGAYAYYDSFFKGKTADGGIWYSDGHKTKAIIGGIEYIYDGSGAPW